MRLGLRWGTLVVLCLVGCAGKRAAPAKGSVVDCEAIRAYLFGPLAEYRGRVDEASRRYQEEQWKVETAAADASPERMAELFAQSQKAAYDREDVGTVRAMDEAAAAVPADKCPWRAKLSRIRAIVDAEALTDPKVIQLERRNQEIQDQLASKSNAFRMTLPGDTEPVSRALYGKRLAATTDRAQREKLYHAFQAARAEQWIAWGFRDLLKARNEEGRAAGYPNFYQYRFFRGQLDYKDYRARVAEIRTLLAPKARRFLVKLGKQAGIARVQPWDIRFLRDRFTSGAIDELLKELPEDRVLVLGESFYRSLGIDVPAYRFQMDLYPRAGKNTHAFAMALVMPHVDIDGKVLPAPKQDIRFLANLKKPVRWSDASTVVHELGHAVHAAEVRQPLASFRGIGSVATEAFAMFLERLSNSSEFLEAELPKVLPKAPPAAKLRDIGRGHERAARVEQALMLLRQVFFSDVEHEMYQNPDADFGQLWARLHEEYWGVKVDPKEADWDVEHFVMAPVYVQNYAIGILMVEQLYASLGRQNARTPALGDRLRKQLFAPGDELTYLQLTERFSGKPLSAAAAARLFDGT